MLASAIHTVLMHWTGIDTQQSKFYDFWSGIGPALIAALPLWAGLILFVRHHNCHVQGCLAIRTSVEPDSGFRACKNHHTKKHLHGINPHAS